MMLPIKRGRWSVVVFFICGCFLLSEDARWSFFVSGDKQGQKMPPHFQHVVMSYMSFIVEAFKRCKYIYPRCAGGIDNNDKDFMQKTKPQLNSSSKARAL